MRAPRNFFLLSWLLSVPAYASLPPDFGLPNLLELPGLHTVIGGSAVGPGDPVARSTVGLQMGGGGVCTATIIEKDVLVTAAHCLERGGGITVSFGSDLDSDVTVRARSHRMHPSFGGRGRDEADIGVVLLGGSLPRGYAPVPVLGNSNFREGQPVIIAGYGVSDGRRDSGSGRLRKAQARVLRVRGTEVLIDQRQGTGACRGDSGGPGFVQNSRGELQVWGVVSRGPRFCDEEGIFTRIDSHVAWVKQTIAQLRQGGRGEDDREERDPGRGRRPPPPEEEDDRRYPDEEGGRGYPDDDEDGYYPPNERPYPEDEDGYPTPRRWR